MFLLFMFSLPHIIVLSSFLGYTSATCWFPDGKTIADTYITCNTTRSEAQSACCDAGDPCSTNGFCMGNAGFAYRGGCTDSTWESPSCAKVCKTASPDSFSNIFPCPVNNGSFAKSFCCGAREGSKDSKAGCCDSSFIFVDKGGTGRFFNPAQFLPASSAQSSSSATSSSPASKTSSSAASSTVTSQAKVSPTAVSATSSMIPEAAATTTPAAARNKIDSANRTAAIAAGVSVPIAVIAIASLGFLLFRERNLRRRAELGGNRASVYQLEATKGNWAVSEPQELENPFGDARELGSKNVHEIAPGSPRERIGEMQRPAPPFAR